MECFLRPCESALSFHCRASCWRLAGYFSPFQQSVPSCWWQQRTRPPMDERVSLQLREPRSPFLFRTARFLAGPTPYVRKDRGGNQDCLCTCSSRMVGGGRPMLFVTHVGQRSWPLEWLGRSRSAAELTAIDRQSSFYL